MIAIATSLIKQEKILIIKNLKNEKTFFGLPVAHVYGSRLQSGFS
jgi:hypothetical protein